MPGVSAERTRHDRERDPLFETRLELLEKGAAVLREAVAGTGPLSSPPWTTLASVHGALGALASGAVQEPAPAIRLLSEELVLACVRLRAGQETSVRLAGAALVRGIVELVRRARNSDPTKPDTLARTLAAVDDLRQLRLAQQISANPLFPLPAPTHLISSDTNVSAEAISHQRTAQLRNHYQRGLSAWVKNRQDKSAFRAALRSIEYLVRYATPLSARAGWFYAAAFVETLYAYGAGLPMGARRLLTAIAHAMHDPARNQAQAQAPALNEAVVKAMMLQVAVCRPAGTVYASQLRELIEEHRVYAPMYRTIGAGGTVATGSGAAVRGPDTFQALLAQLAQSVTAIVQGAAVPADLEAGLARCCDSLALAGRYADRQAIMRQLPDAGRSNLSAGTEASAGGALATSHAKTEVDWPWLALTLRALAEEDAAADGAVTAVGEAPDGLVAGQESTTSRSRLDVGDTESQATPAPLSPGTRAPASTLQAELDQAVADPVHSTERPWPEQTLDGLPASAADAGAKPDRPDPRAPHDPSYRPDSRNPAGQSRFPEAQDAQMDGDAEGPLSVGDLARAAQALRQIEADLAKAQSDRNAGLPFAQPLPSLLTNRPRGGGRGGVLEPVDEARIAEPESTVGPGAGSRVDLEALASRVCATDAARDQPDNSQDNDRHLVPAPGAGGLAEHQAARTWVDTDLLDNLNWIAREIGASQNQTETHVGTIRENAMDLDRTLRSLGDELRRLRSETGALEHTGDAFAQQPAAALPPGLPGQLSERIERLTQDVSSIARIQGSLESLAGEARQQLKKQVQATGSLQAGLARSGAVSLSTVWDRVIVPVRQRSGEQGPELVFALTGGSIILALQVVAEVEDAFTHALVALAEAASLAAQPASSQRPVRTIVIDVQAAEAGPTLIVSMVLRGLADQCVAPSILATARGHLALHAAAVRADTQALELRVGLAPKLMKLLPLLSIADDQVAFDASEVSAVLPASQVAMAAISLQTGVLQHGGKDYQLVTLESLSQSETAGAVPQDAPTVGMGDRDLQDGNWVLVEAGATRVAFIASSVQEPLVVGVLPLPLSMRNVAVCIGAAILGDGSVLPVLRGAELIHCARRIGTQPEGNST